MAHYVYLPVATQEMKTFAGQWKAGRLLKDNKVVEILHNFESGKGKGFRRWIGLGVLKRVHSADRLYILAHGDGPGSPTIGGDRDEVLKKYTPADLAELVEAEGLIKTFQDLRIFACGSGLVNREKNMVISYAERVRDEMRNRGYHAIQVTGYNGETKTNYTSRAGVEYTIGKGVQTDFGIKRASLHKQIFK